MPLWVAARWMAWCCCLPCGAGIASGCLKAGLIRPVDPILLQFNIWALTEHYALMAPEVRYMLGLAEDAQLDEAQITAEVTTLVLRGLRP